MTLRCGLSPYLNAQPFAAGLLARPNVELIQATPARLCDLLRRGVIDAGLVSSTEYFNDNYVIIPYGSISAVGKGADAVLVGNVPLKHIRTIALAHCSRSTNLMLRLVMHWLFPGRAITFTILPEDTLRALNETDACLLIGDAAMNIPLHAEYNYNISDLWLEHTNNKPAVLSCWLCHPDADLQLKNIIETASHEAVHLLPAIAQAAAARLNLSLEDAKSFFTYSLDYIWDDTHADALLWFAHELKNIGALKLVRDIAYLGESTQTQTEPVSSNHAI